MFSLGRRLGFSFALALFLPPAAFAADMILVHGHGTEAALPEMPAAPAARMNDAGVAAVHGGQRPAQPVGIGRHQDEMHMVGHQAPGPHLHIGLAALLRQEIAVERIILVAEEGARARPLPH